MDLLIAEKLTKEVQSPSERGRVLKLQRPESRILAAVIRIDVAVLHDDRLASARTNGRDHLLERRREVSAILLDELVPVVLAGRVCHPAMGVRVSPGQPKSAPSR